MIKHYLHWLRQIVIDSRPMPPVHDNLEHNRELWDRYAKKWDKDTILLEKDAHKRKENIHILGDEWGTPEDIALVMQEFVYPYITPESEVLEIGVGGGRIANLVAPRVKTLHAFDISPEMLATAQKTLASHNNVRLTLLTSPELPDELTGCMDFAYSFDVFVHLDLHTMWPYFREIHKVLKPGGHAFLHTTNLTAPGGWERFERQKEYAVSGHFFVCPQTVETLAVNAGLSVVRKSDIEPDNFYLYRDFLFIVQKQA